MTKQEKAIEQWYNLGPNVREDLVSEMRDDAEGLLASCDDPPTNDKDRIARDRKWKRKAKRLQIMADVLENISF